MIDFGDITLINESSALEARTKISNLASSLRFTSMQSIRIGVATSEICRKICSEEGSSGRVKISVEESSRSGLYLQFRWDDTRVKIKNDFFNFFDWSQFSQGSFTAYKSFREKPRLSAEFIVSERNKILRKSREQLLLEVKRKNEELRETNLSLQKFVPQDFLNILEKDSIVDFHLGDALAKSFTILFSDMRSFSSHSEGMDPSELFSFVNEFLSVIVPVIHKHGGFVITYLGDAVMAAFPKSTAAALRCSVEMYVAIEKLNHVRSSRGDKEVAIGVGINYGPAMMGIIGQDDRMEPAILSDSVNLAARLESLTKQYQVKTVFSEAALKQILAQDDTRGLKYRLLDYVRVVGKQEPVKIYELLFPLEDPKISQKVQQLAEYEKGLELFYKGELLEAYKILQSLASDNENDVALKNYKSRCAEFLSFDENGNAISQEIPVDYDPIYTLRSK